jgi:carboxyl-terminal processing protease
MIKEDIFYAGIFRDKRSKERIKTLSKLSRITALLLIAVLLFLIIGTAGCRTKPAELDLSIVEEVWDIIFTQYVDRDSLDAGELGQAAVEGMLEALDDPDTDYPEGDDYRPDIDRLDVEGLNLVIQAWNTIVKEGLHDGVDTAVLKIAAIEGIVEALDDPYTAYLEAEYYEVGRTSLEGEFEGIGAYVAMEDEQLIIVAPIADSPAEKAGIMAGDIILEVDGESVEGMNLIEAIMKIRGPRGTAVMLLVLHEDETEPVEIEIIRGRVEVPSVEFEMKEDIAYIVITQFSERTAEELKPVIRELSDADAGGIIIDLRGNSGGLLTAVIDVASHFITTGVVLEVISNDDTVATFRVENKSLTTDLPAVVLVNSYSASGSEVLAGAMQDHHRALVSGNVTFGKGSVNVLNELEDDSGLYITTSRWLTPNGRLIEGQGIEPDVMLELTGDDAVQWAIDYLKENESS